MKNVGVLLRVRVYPVLFSVKTQLLSEKQPHVQRSVHLQMMQDSGLNMSQGSNAVACNFNMPQTTAILFVFYTCDDWRSCLIEHDFFSAELWWEKWSTEPFWSHAPKMGVLLLEANYNITLYIPSLPDRHYNVCIHHNTKLYVGYRADHIQCQCSAAGSWTEILTSI